MQKVDLLYLSQEDIMSLHIGWETIIHAVERALIEHSNGTVENPPKRGVHTRPDSFIHEMPVYLKNMDACGIKWVSGYPANQKKGLPFILGVQVMNSAESGVPYCIMDCRWLTGVRTAAVTAATAKCFARKNSRVLSIVGGGVQGKMHLRALKHVLPSLEECRVYDKFSDVADRFVKEMTGEFPDMRIRQYEKPEEIIPDSDLIFTLTGAGVADYPFMPDLDLPKGVLAGSIESARAWPARICHSADKYITDDLVSTISFGEECYPGGFPEWTAQTGDVISGKKPGRESDDEIVLAFNWGLACEDISLGWDIYNAAKEKGVGTVLPLMQADI